MTRYPGSTVPFVGAEKALPKIIFHTGGCVVFIIRKRIETNLEFVTVNFFDYLLGVGVGDQVQVHSG